MLSKEEIENEFTNEVIRKVAKKDEWHDRLPNLIKDEISERIDHWVGLGRSTNSYTKETKEYLEQLKRAIYLVTKKHFIKHDIDNGNRSK